MERHTGEPCAVKAASTVRRGAVGKVPKGNSLAAYPTIEHIARHVKGQFSGHKTTAAHGYCWKTIPAHPLIHHQKQPKCSLTIFNPNTTNKTNTLNPKQPSKASSQDFTTKPIPLPIWIWNLIVIGIYLWVGYLLIAFAVILVVGIASLFF